LSHPEIRIDQLTGLRTILAPGRASRPEAFAKAARDLTPVGRENCPFCEGAEEQTPPESWAFRPGGGDPDSPGWIARSMPNLYPVFGESPVTIVDRDAGSDPSPASDSNHRATQGSDPTGSGPAPSTLDPRSQSKLETGLAASIDPLRASTRATEPNLFASTPAEGAHEVLVNAPEHVVSMAELSEERFGTAVSFWRERMRAFRDESAYLHLIVNEAPEAGASREHTHAQLYALRFVPAEIARERERMKAYYERTMGGDLLGDVLTEEIRRRERVVAVDDEAVLLCPWASRSPFEMRIVPRAASPSFELDDEVGTAMIRRAIRGLAKLFGPPPFNLWVRTAPRDADRFHWHVDIVPRLTVLAGFELGTGAPINVYPPERAAADLREALA
jgi:UDPglucose--hexose-1-phosphate uridylyltransferase